jgi:hypothetical protein
VGLNRLEMMAMSADPQLAPHVVRQMVASGVDLVVHLASYQRGERPVRRLGSLALVAENSEDPLSMPVVQEICRYLVGEDRWQWDQASLQHMPAKIADKFRMAGQDPGRLLYQVVSHES